jgi:ClpP class serine protease
MNHSLFRLRSKIYNVPHLITAEAFNVVLDYFDYRNSDSFKLIKPELEVRDAEFQSAPQGGGIGVLCIDGSLTYKPVMTMCGEVGTSYQSLEAQVEALAEEGVKTIVMEVSSGGGEASHCFQTAQSIRAICDANDIKLIGYADTLACSAAYAMIVVCDEVVVNPDATVGSIGCVVALMDTSKAMEQAGLKRIFVTSGESKVPFAEDGSFKAEFIEEIQAEVNRLNDLFAMHVSEHTGLSAEDIKGFEAGTFSADEAVSLGLANKVMTNKEFAAYVASQHKGM